VLLPARPAFETRWVSSAGELWCGFRDRRAGAFDRALVVCGRNRRPVDAQEKRPQEGELRAAGPRPRGPPCSGPSTTFGL